MISFAPGLSGTIQLQSALPDLTHGTEIAGPGANLISVRGERGFGGLDDSYPIFRVNSGSTVTVRGLTIANGQQLDAGGVVNGGTMHLLGVAVVGNKGTDLGGGIANAGTMTVRDSTIAGNEVSGGVGGGIFNQGVLTIENSTITANSAGGAILSESGGGVLNWDPAGGDTITIRNSTIAANSAPGAANIGSNGAGTAVSLSSTVVANPLGGGSNCGSAVVTSLGFNLDSGSSCGLNQASDLVAEDPLLGPLAANGGSTMTLLPGAGSPALDNGIANGLALDQRSLARTGDLPAEPNAPGGDGTDIGAVEVQPPSVDPPPADPPADPTEPGDDPVPDTVAPETTIDEAPDKRIETRKDRIRIRFEFSSSEPESSFRCKLDKDEPKPCTSPFKIKVGLGRHKFRVWAVDAAGNADPKPAKHKFEVLAKE